VPCAVALTAIALAGPLVVPGVLLPALFALTGASDRLAEPLPAALLDSVAVVRMHAKQVAIVVALMIAQISRIAAIANVRTSSRTGPPSVGVQLAGARTVRARDRGRADRALATPRLRARGDLRRETTGYVSRVSAARRLDRVVCPRDAGAATAAARRPYQIARPPRRQRTPTSADHESPMWIAGVSAGTPSWRAYARRSRIRLLDHEAVPSRR